jgi:small subunit ribosomal protein S7
MKLEEKWIITLEGLEESIQAESNQIELQKVLGEEFGLKMNKNKNQVVEDKVFFEDQAFQLNMQKIKKEGMDDFVGQTSLPKTWIEIKWVNCLIRKGKKSVAERIHWSLLGVIKQQRLKVKDLEKDPQALFCKAIEKARPYVEVKKVRKGGTTHHVPVEIPINRQYFKVFTWLRTSALKKKGQAIVHSLYAEITGILNNSNNCSTLQKRDELHQLAEKNREYAHYRW